MKRYAIVIEDAGPNLAAYVPDLPECVATGESVGEVERLIREAKVPQRQRQVATMSDAGIFAYELDPERRACAVVEVYERALATVASSAKISSIEPRQAP